MKLLLASKSPRRRELLKMLDIPFKIVETEDIDEIYPESLSAEDVPCFLSKLKVSAYPHELQQEEVLITADTVVILNNEILGKPHDLKDAGKMLRKISGNTHHVISGVTLTGINKSITFSTLTEVEFDILTDEQIDFYVEKYKPLDKAGAYGIQEWIGAVGIAGIRGSYYNVMGLPIHQLYKALSDFR